MMTPEEADQALRDNEASLHDLIAPALNQTADDFVDALDDATEIVAARYSVSSIRSLWNRHVPSLMDRIRTQGSDAGTRQAAALDAELPDGWDDELADVLAQTEQLLSDVGDDLSREANRVLAEGLNEGDDVDQLRERLKAAFATDGPYLGPGRADRIAATEATRAWNSASLAAARALTGPERPLVKQWVSRHDDRVRVAHADADAQLQLLDDPFSVGGVDMLYPGDPAAPADLTINCRCVMMVQSASTERTASMADGDDYQSDLRGPLRDYWIHGEGSAKIGWGTPGSFTRCVAELDKYFPEDPEGLCANLYHEATGRWPGQQNATETLAEDGEVIPVGGPPIVTWGTPTPAALAYTDQQTGDGRLFAEGSLTWDDGPWPLGFVDKATEGHAGSELAGAIYAMRMEGNRLAAAGVLYLTRDAGLESAQLLAQGAPLGVSVDLDNVHVEFVDTQGRIDEGDLPEDTPDPVTYRAELLTASVTRLDDGRWVVEGRTASDWRASGTLLASSERSENLTFVTDEKCHVPAPHLELSAAAGDADPLGGQVLAEQGPSDVLMRITSARVRGATLVTIPAYVDACIHLDNPQDVPMPGVPVDATASAATNDYDRVVRHVRKSLVPVTPGDAARFLGLPVHVVRRHLATAAKEGKIMRITRGTYVAPVDEMAAAASGATDLPIAGRDVEWDGQAAQTNVISWADGDAGKLGQAFFYHEDGQPGDNATAYKLGFADVVDGTLTIIPRGVFAAAAALQGSRGGVDIPADQVDAVRAKVTTVYNRMADQFNDPSIVPPWNQSAAETDDMDASGYEEIEELAASAWDAMKDLPPMPAAWFREPTADELPAGGPGVNYASGRIFGWVAQAGEAHAGYAKKVTIEGLGKIDTSHFLRQRFELDDGSTVKAGAFTMDVGHHRDGAECETSACQFDSTRTVAGIVTVGMNERGLWFSGAASPWVSEVDRRVFLACQPSYHMKRGNGGQWQLRAVLSVPVPGHSSPLTASMVSMVDRANMALTASARLTELTQMEAEAPQESAAPELDYTKLADEIVASMARAEQRKADEAAELQSLLELAASIDDPEGYDVVDTGTKEE
jgi:hypothetical protein